MLGSIRNFFEFFGVVPEDFQFRKEEFNSQTIIDALTKEPKKCPVITAADLTDFFISGNVQNIKSQHAMVTAGALKGSEFMSSNTVLADQWFIKCKNSYGNDPTQPGKIQ